MSSNLQCPIDHVKVNENKARIIAFLVLLCGVAFLLTGYIFIVLLLLFDFFVRVFNKPALSPLGFIADAAIKQFKIANKPTDRGPKRFAAGMGLALISIILISSLYGAVTLCRVLTIMLCFFAFLESFIGLCVGCYIYTALQKVNVLFKKA